MVKTKGPAVSAQAAGTIADVLVFSKSKSGFYIKKHTKPKQPNTQPQLANRAIVSFLAKNWKELNTAQQATWSADAATRKIASYHSYMGINAARWRHFKAPSKEDPATESGIMPPNGALSAVGGKGHITWTIWVNIAKPFWGAAMFRFNDVLYIPSLQTLVAVNNIGPTAYTTIVETNVAPGLWRLMYFPFSPTGLYELNTRYTTATVT